MPRGHATAGHRVARKAIDTACEICGSAFTARRSSARYCSGRCQKRAGALRRPQRQCVVCAEWFHPVKPTAVSCSAACRQVYVARTTAEARANKRRDSGATDWYRKVDGRHEHRGVAERMIGRPLRSDEVVHHINGDKRDNRPENLEVMTRSAHTSMHTSEWWEARRAA